MRYLFIQELHRDGRFTLGTLCRALRVCTAGYYAWRRRSQAQPGLRTRQEADLLRQIEACHRRNRGTYGNPRVYQELKASGVSCGRHRAARILRKHGLSARPLKRFARTTDSNHGLSVAPNHLQRQ